MIREVLEAEGAATFDAVEGRLLEAWQFLRRMPGGFCPNSGASDGPWHLIVGEPGDYSDMESDAPRRLPGLTAREVGRMEEALGWVEWVDPRERKLIGIVLRRMDMERAARPAWIDAAHDWARATGSRLMPDTLRMRYGRAISTIAGRLGRIELAA